MNSALANTASFGHDGARIRAVIAAIFVARLLAVGSEQFGLPELSRQTAGLMLAAMAIFYLVDGKFSRRLAAFSLGLLGWMVWALLSAAGGPVADPVAAASLGLVLGFYLLFGNLLWTRFDGAQGLRAIGRMLTVFMVLGVVLSAYQLASGTGFVDPGKPDIRRVFGADVHPVSFGLQLVTAMAGLTIVNLKQGRRPPYWLITFGCGALYLTYARTAWGMMGLVVLIYAFALGNWRSRFALAALGAVAAAVLIYGSSRFDDLASLPEFVAGFDFAHPVFDYRTIDNSLNWRIVNWAFGAQQSGDALWFGHGPGQSAIVSQFHLEMHNILLEALFELGLPGLCAVLLTLGGLIHIHRRLPRPVTTAQRQANALANGVGMGLLVSVMISTSLVDQLTTVTLYLMVLRAAAIGCPRQA